MKLLTKEFVPYLIIAVAIAVLGGYGHYLKSGKQRAEAEVIRVTADFANYRADQALLVKRDNAKHQQELNLAINWLNDAEKQHEAETIALLDKLKKGERRYEKVTIELSNERNVSRVLHDRLQASLTERQALASNTKELAEGRRKCSAADIRQLNRHIQYVELAGALSAADFNYCRKWMDKTCELMTCGE